MRRASGLVAALATLVLGCHAEGPVVPSAPAGSGSLPAPTASTDVGPTLIAPVADADDLLYYCANIPFPLSVLAQPGGDELANHPASNALRLLLASQPDAFLPNRGWIFVGESLTIAEFIAREPIEGDPFGGYYAAFDKAGLQYKARSWGGCRPRLHAPPSTFSLEWSMAGLTLPAPDAMNIDVEVLGPESFCGPDPTLVDTLSISSDVESITVTLLADGVERRFDCPGPFCGPITPTPITVTLPEQVGARKLLDGSTYPGRSVTSPWERGCGG